MKKIPTLFVREYLGKGDFVLTRRVTPGYEWVLKGEGEATIKIDGSATAIIDGDYYKRYDAKGGKTPPPGAIACSKPDPITGHWPHWVRVDKDKPEDRWYYKAYLNAGGDELEDATYEAVGPHFQRNPYALASDTLKRHGIEVVKVERSYEGIKKYLEEHYIEGLVFWKDGEAQCKIKRRDYGLPWNQEGERSL